MQVAAVAVHQIIITLKWEVPEELAAAVAVELVILVV